MPILIFDIVLQAGLNDWLAEIEQDTAHDHLPFPVNNSFHHMVSSHHLFSTGWIEHLMLEYHHSDAINLFLILEPSRPLGLRSSASTYLTAWRRSR